MATKKLTQAMVEKITPPATGREDHFDSLVTGFGLRVSSTGRKTWFVWTRLNGVARRYGIGKFEQIGNVGDARDAAKLILQQVARGEDPTPAPVASAPDAPPAPAPETVRWLATEFIERYAKPKNKSWPGTEETLRLHVLPKWGDRAPASITRRDVHALLDGIIDGSKAVLPAPDGAAKAPRAVGGPIAANHTLAAIRRMFNWAAERDIITKSPVEGVRPPAPAVARDRVLEDDELSKLYIAAKAKGGIGGGYVRALILTAQRRSEVAGMRWSDIDIAKRSWTLPAAMAKNGREHVIPLSAPMIVLLATLPRDGAYVFTSTKGERPLSGFSKLKLTMDQLSGVSAWRYHDLRRSAATGMAEHCKIADSTIGRILNHTETSVTRKHYNKYDYFDEKRDALDAWAARVEKLTRPAPVVKTETNLVEWLELIDA